MDAAVSKEIVAVLTVLAKIIEELGPGGLMTLLIGSPVMMVAAFAVQTWRVTSQCRALVDRYRDDLTKIMDDNRKYIFELWEKHRGETQDVLKQYGENHAKVTRFYEDNVELVKDYEHMAVNFQDMVVMNTQAIEKLTAVVDAVMKNK